jgi:diguanylate cyclase (GGDEF)-like protein
MLLPMLAIVHGIGLFSYAKTQSTFRGFWHIGAGFFALAFGFLIISFRGTISDWLTIVVSACLVIYSLILIGVGILKFFNFPSKNYQVVCFILLGAQVVSSSFFGDYSFDPQWRITILCSIFAMQSFYLAIKLYLIKDDAHTLPIRLLYSLFTLYGLIFMVRAVWTFLYFDEAGEYALEMGHLSSLLTFLLLLVATSLIIIWTASEQLQSKLRHQATIDPLTQVYNRRALESIAENEISRSIRQNLKFTIVMMDIDNFKQLNDQHGHQFGDFILNEFCQLIVRKLRSHDILARYGGEEFVLLLPNTKCDDGIKVAEKLREVIANYDFCTPDSDMCERVSASFGVTQFKGENTSWHTLISKADEALYQAKESGKNKVVYVDANI